jgi:FixJ family two-component response regulator
MRNIFEMAGLSKKVTAGLPGRPAGEAGSNVRGGAAVAGFKDSTVLVLDDDASVCRSLKRLLSASGFRVRTFEKPSQLLATDIPSSNACMLVDICLPEMTGIQACEILKSSGRALPTILITGRTDTNVLSLATKPDAVAVLFKPFTEKELLDAIACALSLSI